MSADELVLGVSRALLPAQASWRGVLYGDVAAVLETIAQAGTFRPRSDCETDPSWKQVIPYVVLRDRGSIFLMRRTRAGSDARLHERYSVGIGGHVNHEDGDLAGGLVREWREELEADWTPDFRPIGLLNDDSDAVGVVHVGVVYSVDADGRPAQVRETDKLEGAFVPPVDVLRVYDRLETWSSLVYDFVMARAAGTSMDALRRSTSRPR